MFEFLELAWRHRLLIARLARRELEERYRGSLLGLVWTILMPLAMLGIYSFVFGGVFGARWNRPHTASIAEYGFPIIMFSGLVVFTLFQEAVNRSPRLILTNRAYVTKMVFPLEVLPFVAVLSSLVTAAVSLAVLFAAFIIFYGLPPFTVVSLPLILLPIALITLGFVYLLSSLGVFLRDLEHVMPLLTTAMLFMSPVFYQIDQLPAGVRILIYLNPLTIGIDQMRQALFWGQWPNPAIWLAYLTAAALFSALCAYWFSRTRKAFADVL